MVCIFSLEHAPYEDPVYITRWLANRSLEVNHIRLYRGDPLPDLSDVGFLLIMGGPMNIYEEDKYPWIIEEKSFIKNAIFAEIPILGICLGGQLIADVLGGIVTKSIFPEYGWHTVTRNPDIYLNPDMEENIISRLFPERIDVFQWHQDTFTIPSGAIPLYRSDFCFNQAFMYNNKVVGLQFHPEMDKDTIQEFLNLSNQELTDKGLLHVRDDILHRIDLCTQGHNFVAELIQYLINSDEI